MESVILPDEKSRNNETFNNSECYKLCIYVDFSFNKNYHIRNDKLEFVKTF